MKRCAALLFFGFFLFLTDHTACAKPLESVTLQLKWRHQFQFAGYYAALEHGYYRAAGLDVKLQERMPGVPRSTDIVLQGAAEYGVEGSHLVTQRLKGQPLVALAAIFQHSPAVTVALEKSGIKSALDLAGKRVMSYGSADVELNAMLLSEGLTTTGIQWLPHSYDIQSLVSGETDLISAYLTNEPYFLRQQQIPYSIINPSNYGVDFYSDFLFTTEKELRENPERVKKFLEASMQGWRYATKHPEEIVDLIQEKYHPQKSPDHLRYEAEQTISLIRPDRVEIGHINPGRVKRMANDLLRLGRVSQLQGLEGFIYAERIDQSLSSEELAWLQQQHPVRLLVFHAPPLISLSGGKVEGLLIDYLDKLTTRYGVRFEYVEATLEQALSELAAKNGVDAIPILRQSPERRRQMLYSEPYLSMESAIFTREDSSYIAGIEDLAGRKIAVPRGYLLQSVLTEQYPEIGVETVPSVQEALKLLAAGEIDAYIGNLLMASHVAKDLGLANIKVAAPVHLLEPAHSFAVRDDWPELVSLFNRVLRDMSSEEKAEIRRRWMSLNYEYGISQQTVWVWLAAGGGLFVLCAILFLGWNRSLQKEVKLRKRTETALVNSVTQYQHLVQTLPHGLLEINRDFRISYCNEPVKKLLGYTVRELNNKLVFDLVDGKQQASELRQLFAELHSSRQHQSLKLHLLGREKTRHAVRLDCDFTPSDQFDSQIVVVTDLTQQERVEQALVDSEETYRRTFEHIQVGIVHIDKNGRYRRANRYFCQLLGYSLAELTNLSFAEITHPEDIADSRTRMDDLRQLKVETYSIDKRYLHKNGRVIWVLVTVSRLESSVDEDEFVAVIQDIDNLKRQQQEVEEKSQNLESIIAQRTGELQQRIEQVEKLNSAMLNLAEDLQTSYRQLEERTEEAKEINQELEAFAYSVSHDLRAPLRHVQGFAAILRQAAEGELSEKNSEHLNVILTSAERMGRLIDDLLEFSRAGRSELRFQRLDTQLLVRDAINQLSSVYPQRKIDWRIAELPSIEGDLGTFRQVFMNLLENAVKYSEPRELAVIEVGSQSDAEEQVFYVSDNGVGFDPQYSHKLFGVFSRLHRADQFSGSGIGLANVKRIIKRHGGRVWAESDGNSGARFCFALPRSEG